MDGLAGGQCLREPLRAGMFGIVHFAPEGVAAKRGVRHEVGVQVSAPLQLAAGLDLPVIAAEGHARGG
jgi:hypothetical protein